MSHFEVDGRHREQTNPNSPNAPDINCRSIPCVAPHLPHTRVVFGITVSFSCARVPSPISPFIQHLLWGAQFVASQSRLVGSCSASSCSPMSPPSFSLSLALDVLSRYPCFLTHCRSSAHTRWTNRRGCAAASSH